MRVVEIIIDGFKSYAVRTVIQGWDESFNSITGLNGSGKSNILDAICFVLGITNMTTMRAQNLQDLIYKRGQAGVTKASVTIVFDNSDKSKSPINYESFPQISVTRQIVMGGTSKYLINGSRTQQQVVQTLFQSVGLNINNPNFLIMQGRITKVLNMKATEILSMIEEAAGTRMFEDRKEKAFKTMAKKDKKVDEINELLKEEIEPKLEKLRMEKRAFLDFQQTQNDLERLTKLVVSHEYVRSKEKVEKSGADLEAKKQRAKDIEDSAHRLKYEIENLAEDVKRVKAQRDKELRKGGRFQELEEEVRAASHEVVRLNTVIELKRTGLAEEQNNRNVAEKTVKDLEKLLQDKTKVYEKLKGSYDAAKSQFDSLSAEAEKKEELLQTLQTGVASKEGQESGYQNQLQEARNLASTAATEQEQAKMKITHLEKRIKEEEPRAKKAKQQNQTLYQDLDNLKAESERIKSQMASLGYEEGKEEEVRQEEATIVERIRELKANADALRRRVANMEFNYSDPSPNWDRSRVKGLVAQLFTLDEDKTEAGMALEICAGGRLYNVVVDTAATSTELLQKGKLRKRVTIIPLNKISAFKASAQKIATAQKIAPGKAELALSLIGYDQEVTAAMEFIFGSTFICKDADAAKRVTFDPAIRMRCVTFEGDVFDPSGTLSGGSAPSTGGVLVTMQKLNRINQEMDELTTRLNAIRQMMIGEKQKLDAVHRLKNALELKTHEISLTEQQINSNSSSDIIQKVEDMKENVKQLKQDIIDAKKRQDEATKEAKRIETDIKDFKNNKDSKLAELQNSVDKLKKNVAKQSQDMKGLHKDFQTAQLETEQAGGDLAAAQEQLQDVESNIKSLESEISDLLTNQSAAQDAHDIARAQLEDEQAKLSGFDDELHDLEDATRKKQSQIAEEALEKQRLGHEIERFLKEQHSAQDRLIRLTKEHDWITGEEDQFGRPGTPYDFNNVNINEVRSSLNSLQERSQGMKKKINPKVMNMIDSVEKKEAGLKKNIVTVIKDKRKIEETVAELDRYKKEALEKTHAKVSKDFGNIFAELLPGSFAKLVPLEGKEVSDGLEVKVQLGKVWKQSLTELSGGQRSLIALSLIMALLQFKPAPMYILDEVDAALDLSHTQNIGRLIKTRFKGSQFIVVSLKDGMFQNANCIFRTRFVDGTSVVQAITSSSA